MASGGARARSGPAPDPNALRRSLPGDAAGWTTLPSEGRSGDAPAWPLTAAPDAAERHHWATLWKSPQAVQWERMGVAVEVALYVRRLVEAELPGAPVALGTLLRQMQESLGLSVTGMARNRWRIAVDETAAARAASGEPVTSPSSSRSRFKVVAHAAGE